MLLFIGSLLIFVSLGSASQHPLHSFFYYTAAHSFLYIIIFKIFPSSHSPMSMNLKLRLFSSSGIIFIGIILRLFFINYPPSDDVNRYAWEGMIQSKGINPYIHSAQEFYLEYKDDPIYQDINHKEIPTIYPPLSMAVFRGLSTIFYNVFETPEAILKGYKLFFILCDFALMLLLASLVKSWDRPTHWLALYAWNPLVILYGAGEGHIDVLHALFVVAVVVCFNKKNENTALGFFMLGCAVMTKYYAVILLPFVINHRNIKQVFYGGIPLVLFALYWDVRLSEALSTFTIHMHYNDVIAHWFRILLPEKMLSNIMMFVFGLGMLWIWALKQDDLNRSITLCIMWFLLCLSTLHPWYLIIIIPFLIYSPSRAWFILLISMGCNFWTYHDLQQTGQWNELPWIWFGTYGLFLFIMIWDFYRHNYFTHKNYQIPASIDIVIPTLNEGERIDALKVQLQKNIDYLKDNWHELALKIKDGVSSKENFSSPAIRVYFIDGGSSDNTLQSLKSDMDATVIQLDLPSRGKQFSEGIKKGNGDVILMLHADAKLPENMLVNLMKAFIVYDKLQWGIVGHRYETRPLKMKIIEWSNRLRFSHFGLAFGDQGIFVRRKVLDGIGGMPEIRLMEDVEVSLRLNKCLNRINLGGLLIVSTRSWKQKKFTGYTRQVMKLVSSYLFLRRFGADIHQLSSEMYDIYYQKK